MKPRLQLKSPECGHTYGIELSFATEAQYDALDRLWFEGFFKITKAFRQGDSNVMCTGNKTWLFIEFLGCGDQDLMLETAMRVAELLDMDLDS